MSAPNADSVRPTGPRWWGHVLSCGGLCLIHCPHFAAHVTVVPSAEGRRWWSAAEIRAVQDANEAAQNDGSVDA